MKKAAEVKTHLASAYLTFVALGKDKRPVKVPPLKLVTKEDFRRNSQALARRKLRLLEKKKEPECHMDTRKY